MPHWLSYLRDLLFVLALLGGTICVGKFLRPPRVRKAPKLNLSAGFLGAVIEGQPMLSPGQTPCVAYGIVIGRMEGEDNDVFVELHRGGWTNGFLVRSEEGNIISVPKGPIHVDGARWAVTHQRHTDASTYLANADVPGEASGAVFASRARILEVCVKLNASVAVHATKFEEQLMEAHGAEPPYRHGQRKHVAQGDVLVRMSS